MKLIKHNDWDFLRCRCNSDYDKDLIGRRVYCEEASSLLERKRGKLMIISLDTCPTCSEYYWYFTKAPHIPKPRPRKR